MTKSINVFETSRMSEAEINRLFEREESDLSPYIEKVLPIVNAVREEGDEALLRFTKQFDKVNLGELGLRVSEEEIDAAESLLDSELVESIKYAIANITRYHQAQMPSQKMWFEEICEGVYAGERYTPIDTVACYVPRGKASYPSTVMMVSVPAIVAGVPRPIILTPPGPDGSVDPATLLIAKLVGISEIYRVGGAQAVAAAAYGTQTIPKCDKFLGPGSPWVMAAKRLVLDKLDPGISAGPSECAILADDTANGKVIALDLAIESEHGDDSSVYLVTSSRRLVQEVQDTMEEVWSQLNGKRQQYSRAVLCGEIGGIVLTETMDEAIDFVNHYAPEHLSIQCKAPFEYLGHIVNASEILLGEDTPVSIGNFALGANAVLPTNGTAKTISPLSVFDYMKRNSVGQVTKKGYAEIAKHSHRIGVFEGFDGHALAVSDWRLKYLNNTNKGSVANSSTELQKPEG